MNEIYYIDWITNQTLLEKVTVYALLVSWVLSLIHMGTQGDVGENKPEKSRDPALILGVIAVILVAMLYFVPGEFSVTVATGYIAFLIALVGKETLTHWVAGRWIQRIEPFKQGDWITVESRDGREGKVVDIGTTHTIIQSDREVEDWIPNSQISNRPFTKMDLVPTLFEIEIQGWEIRKNIDKIGHIIAKIEEIPQSPAPRVDVIRMSRDSAIYQITYWIEPQKYQQKYTHQTLGMELAKDFESPERDC